MCILMFVQSNPVDSWFNFSLQWGYALPTGMLCLLCVQLIYW